MIEVCENSGLGLSSRSLSVKMPLKYCLWFNQSKKVLPDLLCSCLYLVIMRMVGKEGGTPGISFEVFF